MSDEIVSYRGKRVEDMTREELVDAVKTLGRLLHDSHRRAMSTHDMYDRLRKARVSHGY